MIYPQLTKQELEAYTDENKFTEEVVIPLFEVISEVEGYKGNGAVKIEFWGKDKRLEGKYGFDVYFGYTDCFNKHKHLAIQCKCGNITLGSNASLTKSIETIKNQIEKAYGTKFTSPLATDNESTAVIDGFFLITSGVMKQDARDFFINLGFTNIECFDASDLEFLVKKYSLERQRL